MEQPKKLAHEAWVESLNTPESIQRNFLYSKKIIERLCGITLTNIELVGLSNINKEVMEEVYLQERNYRENQPDNESSVNHQKEVSARFFLRFFDINPSDIDRMYTDFGKEKFQQFFRSKQAALHMP